jgi:hypothetical protein
MAKKRTLNERRLTSEQVAHLIKTEALLHEDYTARIEEIHASGFRDQPKVYSLPGDRILYVFDAIDPALKGKGDIYPAGYFTRFVRWVERVREDAICGRNSSVAHWAYYSTLRERIPAEADRLRRELSERIGSPLDNSYASLDLVSAHVEEIGIDRAMREIYDHLVAFVGEVFRKRTGGHWTIRRDDDAFPYIEGEGRALMPINVVWENLDGLDPVDLRSSATQEVRSTASKMLWRRKRDK